MGRRPRRDPADTLPGTAGDPSAALVDAVARFYSDSLGFVLFAYLWGKPGILRDADGPDTWQRKFLLNLGREVRERDFDGAAWWCGAMA